MHPNPGIVRRATLAPDLLGKSCVWCSAGVVVAAQRAVLGDGVRTPCGQSGSLRGFKLVLSKWRSLVPPMLRNTPKGHNAHRWAANQQLSNLELRLYFHAILQHWSKKLI